MSEKRNVRIVRLLVYEGPEDAVLAGLSYRAVRGERELGSIVKCYEAFYSVDDVHAAVLNPNPETRRMRTKIDALPEPERNKVTGYEPAAGG